MLSRKRSVAWDFFETVDSETVRCLLCSNNMIRYEQGSTTNMLRHLRAKHPAEVKGMRGRVAETAPINCHEDMETDSDHFCSGTVSSRPTQTSFIIHIHYCFYAHLKQVSFSVNRLLYLPLTHSLCWYLCKHRQASYHNNTKLWYLIWLHVLSFIKRVFEDFKILRYNLARAEWSENNPIVV